MTTVVSQPAASKLVVAPGSVRNWSSGIGDCQQECCSSVGMCLCLPCMTCRISTRLGDNCLMPFCVPNSSTAMRTRIRTLGGIKGTICGDCVASTFCGPCVVCQMSRELDAMGL